MATLSRDSLWTLILAAVFLLALGALGVRSMGHAAPVLADYYDEETGVFSVRASTEIPPLVNAAGHAVIVRAIYVTCDSSGGQKRVLAYFEKFSPEAKSWFDRYNARQVAPSPDFLRETQAGHLVRAPEPHSPWVHADTPHGVAVMLGVSCPDGARARYAPPVGP